MQLLLTSIRSTTTMLLKLWGSLLFFWPVFDPSFLLFSDQADACFRFSVPAFGSLLSVLGIQPFSLAQSSRKLSCPKRGCTKLFTGVIRAVDASAESGARDLRERISL